MVVLFRICGSFLRDCGHDEAAIQQELERKQQEEQQKLLEKRKRKERENSGLKASANKRKKSRKVEVSYEEAVLFIESNNNASKKGNSDKQQEFYSESYLEDFEDLADAMMEVDEERGEYDSDYVEEERISKAEVTPRSSHDVDISFINESKPSTSQNFQTQLISNAVDDRGIPFLIEITESSKQLAKTFHKIFYDNCIYHSIIEKSRYEDQVREIKNIDDINMLWTLLNLCFNFIINLSSNIRIFCRDRDLFHVSLNDFDLSNFKNSWKTPDSKNTLESHVDGEEINVAEERIKAMKLLAEKITFFADQQQILFEKIEKSGIDVFNESTTRFNRLLKKLQKSPTFFRFLNKKQIKQKLEHLTLQVNTVSVEMSAGLKEGRNVIQKMYASFEKLFHSSVEDALKEDDSDSENGEEEEEEMDDPENDEISTDAEIVELDESKENAIGFRENQENNHRKAADKLTGIEKSKKLPSKPRKASPYSSLKDFIVSDNESEAEFLPDDKMAKKAIKKINIETMADFRSRLKSLQQKKKKVNANHTIASKSIPIIDDLAGFIDSEDEFELLNLEKSDIWRRRQSSGEIPTYFPQHRDRANSSRNNVKQNRKNPKFGGGGSVVLTSTRFDNKQSNVWDRKAFDKSQIESVNQVAEASSHLYHRVPPAIDPKLVYDGRVTVIYDVSSFCQKDRGTMSDPISVNLSLPRHSELSHRFSDVLLESTVPTFYYHRQIQEDHLPLRNTEVVRQSEELNKENDDENEKSENSFKESVSSLFKTFEKLLSEFPPNSSSIPDVQVEKVNGFEFLCKVWDAMTTTPPLPIPASSDRLYSMPVFMNESLLLQPFPQQWSYFQHYLNSFIRAKYYETFYQLPQNSRNLKEIINDHPKLIELAVKVFRIIFSVQFEKFYRMKLSTVQENLAMFTDTPVSTGSQSIVQTSKNEEFDKNYFQALVTLAFDLERLFASEIIRETQAFTIQHVFSLLFLNYEERDGSYRPLELFFPIQYLKYCFFERTLMLLLKQISAVESSISNPITASEKEKKIELLSCFEMIVHYYYIEIVNVIFHLFLKHPSSCLFFSYQLHQYVQSSSKPPSSSNQVYHGFIRLFYQIIISIESFSKEFQSFPPIIQKKLKEYEVMSFFSMRYLSMKYFDRMNYHLQNSGKESTLSFSAPSINSLFSKNYEHALPYGMKVYKVNTFEFSVANTTRSRNFHENQEVFWIILVVLTNIQFIVQSKEEAVRKNELGQFILRISNNWTFIKFLFQQIHHPLESMLISCPLSEDSNIAADESKLGEWKQDFNRLIRRFLVFYERMTKFSVCWDQGISIGLDFYFQSLHKVLPAFDCLSSDYNFSTQQYGIPILDTKLSQLLSHRSYLIFQKDNGHKNIKKTPRNSIINARQELHHELLFIMHLLFESNNLTHPFQRLFSPSSSDEEGSVTTTLVLSQLSSYFKEFISNSLVSLAPSSNTKQNLGNRPGEISSTALMFDFNLFRKLKSELKKLKKKIYEIFTLNFSTPEKKNISGNSYFRGLLLLSLLKELFHLFGYETMMQEFHFYEEVQNLLLQSSFSLGLIDKQHLILRSSSNTHRLSEDAEESITTPEILLMEQQRSLLLLYNAIVVFNPLPIQTELNFYNHPNSKDPTPANAWNITDFEFFDLMRNQKEAIEKNEKTLSPFLTIFQMVQTIRIQAYQRMDTSLLLSMSSINFACISAATLLIAKWYGCTSVNFKGTEEEYEAENDIYSKFYEQSVCGNAILSAENCFYHSDFSFPSLPLECIIQVLSSINLSVQHLFSQHQQPSSNKVGSRASSSSLTSISSSQLSEFTSYVLILATIIEATRNYQQQLFPKIFYHLFHGSSLSEGEGKRKIKDFCRSILLTNLNALHQIFSLISSIVFHENMMKIYHYLVKKCFIFSNALSFNLPTLDEHLPSILEEYYYNRENSQASRNYYRKLNSYSSLKEYSKNLAHLIQNVLLFEEALTLIKENFNDSWDIIEFEKMKNENSQILEQIWKFNDVSSPFSSFFNPNRGTAIKSEALASKGKDDLVNYHNIDHSTFFTYEILKNFFYSSLIGSIFTIPSFSNVGGHVLTRSRRSMLYHRLIYPQLGHIYWNLVTLSSFLDGKKELLKELQVETNFYQLANLVKESAGFQQINSSFFESIVERIMIKSGDIKYADFQGVLTSFDLFLNLLSGLSSSINELNEKVIVVYERVGNLIFR